MDAVITGATKGMGKAITLRLAEAGYNVFICSRKQTEIDSFCEEIQQKFGVKAAGLQTDCADNEELRHFSEFVKEQTESIDVLVNNAGMFSPASILDEPDGILSKQMQLNFYSAYFLCRVFGRIMREQRRGHIFNICSIAALNPVVTAGSYSVTKAALLSLTKVLREELMKSEVKVTAILPGSTFTASWEGTDLPPERFVSPEDIASGVLMCLGASSGANVDELIIRPLKGQV